MTFGESVSTCFRKYVDFNGRASCSEYWWFFLFCVLVDLGAYMLTKTFGTRLFVVLPLLALWLPLLAAAVRRLHDAGMSGGGGGGQRSSRSPARSCWRTCSCSDRSGGTTSTARIPVSRC